MERVLSRISSQLRELVPEAECHHIGATAIPGALTKGDVDVLLRVASGRFQTVVDELKRHFAVKQPENWTAQFASFGDDTGFELPLGIQVVVGGAPEDFLLFLRDYFASHPEALAEYNRLKMKHAADGPAGYWVAKDGFLAGILAAR